MASCKLFIASSFVTPQEETKFNSGQVAENAWVCLSNSHGSDNHF